MHLIKESWSGRYFEDFAVGEVYRCRFGRTITDSENTVFTLLTHNSNQIHFNHEYAKMTEWGRCLVNSALTLAIVSGMSVPDVSEHGFALGWDAVRLPSPLYAGDTLYSETEIVGLRESASRPQQGIVTVESRGYNQLRQLVIEFRRSVMVWKRGHGPQSGFVSASS